MKLSLQKQHQLTFILLLVLATIYVGFCFILLQRLYPTSATPNSLGLLCIPLSPVSKGVDYRLFIPFGFIAVIQALLLFRACLRILLDLSKTRAYLGSLHISTGKDFNTITSASAIVFTAGIRSPKIYISNNILNSFSTGEISAILLHEQYHVNNHDPLRRLLLKFIQLLLPWFPFKQKLFENFATLAELSADEYAASKMETSSWIVKALAKFSLIQSSFKLALVGFYHNNNRLDILLGKRQFASLSYLLGITAIIGIIIIAITTIVSQPAIMQCLPQTRLIG